MTARKGPYRFASFDGQTLVLRGRLWGGVSLPISEVAGVEGDPRREHCLLVASADETFAATFSDRETLDAIRRALESAMVAQRVDLNRTLSLDEWREELAACEAAAPGMQARMLVASLLERAATQGVTDVHLKPLGERFQATFRRHGAPQDLCVLGEPMVKRLATRLRVLARLPLMSGDGPVEGSFTLERPEGRRVRLSMLAQGGKHQISLRLLGAEGYRLPLEAIGLSTEALQGIGKALERRSGLFVITGPANSGKTTTLYAALRQIQDRSSRHIVTLEDPVELALPEATQIPVQPSSGFGYPQALAAALRHDPEVLMVGEVREAETAQIALEASLSGHLVLATLHGGAPREALRRLLEFGLSPSSLASALVGVVAQRLLRCACTACRATGEAPQGPCIHCLGTGYDGVRPVAVGLWPGADWPGLVADLAVSGDMEERPFAVEAENLLREGVTDLAEVKRLGLL